MITQHARFTLPIYGYDVYVWLTASIKDLRPQLTHLFPDASEQPDADPGGCVHHRECIFGFMITPETFTLSTYSHEVFHLTHRILEQAGDKFDEKHHEPAAYLHGYLMERILKVFRKTPADLMFERPGCEMEKLPNLLEMPKTELGRFMQSMREAEAAREVAAATGYPVIVNLQGGGELKPLIAPEACPIENAPDIQVPEVIREKVMPGKDQEFWDQLVPMPPGIFNLATPEGMRVERQPMPIGIVVDEPHNLNPVPLPEKVKALCSKYGRGSTIKGRWDPTHLLLQQQRDEFQTKLAAMHARHSPKQQRAELKTVRFEAEYSTPKQITPQDLINRGNQMAAAIRREMDSDDKLENPYNEDFAEVLFNWDNTMKNYPATSIPQQPDV